MSEKDKEYLLDILESIHKIKNYIKDIPDCDTFYSQEIIFDAVLMNFVVIGESVVKLSARITGKYKEIEWSKIKGLRNIIAHDYFGIDAEEIWQIIKNNLPIFENQIKPLLEK
ncbi:MAG TPA: hypothetical protein DHW82_01070 [Spirochaetia bacterium]|nr:MAG: hypothetical protein A2Y41_02485 [Spirochaetes bacterium GWB1_36_13]HCL55589.1 hypothetical protein [Spirochaetia bacterium]